MDIENELCKECTKYVTHYTEKNSKEILRRVGEERTRIETIIVWRKKNGIGHNIRELMKEFMEGKIED